MIEQKRKQELMEQLETAASGNDDKALLAKSAIGLFDRGETFGGILNFGLMKTIEGRAKEEKKCKIVFELILYGLFHPDDSLPDQKKWQDEIRHCFNHVTDEETKTRITSFTTAIETVGKMLQLQEKVIENQDSENRTLSQALSKEKKKFDAAKLMLENSMFENHELKNKFSGRQKITQKEAAEICGVSVKTIKNWDKGNGTPVWYHGRDMTAAEFLQRYKCAQGEKKMQDAVRKGLKNPVRLKTN